MCLLNLSSKDFLLIIRHQTQFHKQAKKRFHHTHVLRSFRFFRSHNAMSRCTLRLPYKSFDLMQTLIPRRWRSHSNARSRKIPGPLNSTFVRTSHRTSKGNEGMGNTRLVTTATRKVKLKGEQRRKQSEERREDEAVRLRVGVKSLTFLSTREHGGGLPRGNVRSWPRSWPRSGHAGSEKTALDESNLPFPPF